MNRSDVDTLDCNSSNPLGSAFRASGAKLGRAKSQPSDWECEACPAGASTERVARYMRSGEFGLRRETGELNDIIRDVVELELGLGENAGRRVESCDMADKTIPVRTVADGGESYHSCGDHRATLPALRRARAVLIAERAGAHASRRSKTCIAIGPHLCVVLSMVNRNYPTGITRLTPRRATLTLLIAAALIFSAPQADAATDALDEALQRIQQLIQDRDLAGARSELTRAMQEFPNNGNLYGLLGVVEASAGNYAAAEANLRKAIALIPHYAGAYLNLGRIYQENSAKDPGAAKKALDIYEKLLRFQPDNREAIFQSALLLERQGSFQPALDRLARLSAADQEIPQALAVRCAALAATGKLPEAAAAADRLLQSPQTSDADVLPILPVLESHGASDVAERLLRARAQRRGSYELFYTLGLLDKRRGNLSAAREALEEAAQYRPNDVPLLLDLARVAYDQHDRKGALGYLAHARDLAPQNAGIHFFWGIVCIEENLLEEAYNSLKRAVKLDPENPYYNYAFGQVILPRTDANEAIPVFQKYRQLKPDDPGGLLALGAAFLKNHDNNKARPELEAAAKYSQTAAGAHFYLGRLENQEGDYAGALKHLQLALQAFPEMSEAHAEMGAICLKLKDYPQAEKSLARALELRPENYTANLNLMILYQRTKDPRAPQQAERFRALREKIDKSQIEVLRSIQVQP